MTSNNAPPGGKDLADAAEAVLDAAREINGPGGPDAILPIADLVAAWVFEAATAADLDLRVAAVAFHRHNLVMARHADAPLREAPAEFLAAARQYHAFYAAAGQARRVPDPGLFATDPDMINMEEDPE